MLFECGLNTEEKKLSPFPSVFTSQNLKNFAMPFKNAGNSYKFLIFFPNWMVKSLPLDSGYGLQKYYYCCYSPKTCFK